MQPYDLQSSSDVDFIIYTRQSRRRAELQRVSAHPQKYLFYIHRDKLAAASPIFADMLAVGSDTSSIELSLPCVHLFEDEKTIKVMLGLVYNHTEKLILLDSLNPEEVLDVFEAAMKYEMPTMAHYSIDIMM